jgi:hypothetical protein
LRIEFTPISKKGTMRECDWEKDQERGIKDRSKAKSLSRSRQEDAFEYSGKVDG